MGLWASYWKIWAVGWGETRAVGCGETWVVGCGVWSATWSVPLPPAVSSSTSSISTLRFIFFLIFIATSAGLNLPHTYTLLFCFSIKCVSISSPPLIVFWNPQNGYSTNIDMHIFNLQLICCNLISWQHRHILLIYWKRLHGYIRVVQKNVTSVFISYFALVVDATSNF